ncbi:MAG: hypothetical protein ACK5CA_04080 [Cyanobacteriota bacterium]|jgi:hypothetical protein
MELRSFNQRHLTGGKKAFSQTALMVCTSCLFSGYGQERATEPDNSRQDGTLVIYAKLLNLLPSLGHVGEGHCRETVLNL